MDKISIVVPCYNEELALPHFYKEINEVMKKIKKVKFELLFIDDGSKDQTLSLLRQYSLKDERVRYISFSRNFGKEAGIYAGLKNATGDYIVVLDADLQHPPYLIEEMYYSIKNDGYDSVATKRASRDNEPKTRTLFARAFYEILTKISDTDVVDGAMDFRMMNRKMVDAILSMSEYNRFSKGMFGWVGFTTKWLTCEINDRVAGTTKWSFIKLFLYALEGIVGFSIVPLLIPFVLGMLFLGFSMILMLKGLFMSLMMNSFTLGVESIITTILFVSGLEFIILGLIGQYIAKTYLETKNRPIYIEKENEKSRKK